MSKSNTQVDSDEDIATLSKEVIDLLQKQAAKKHKKSDDPVRKRDKKKVEKEAS